MEAVNLTEKQPGVEQIQAIDDPIKRLQEVGLEKFDEDRKERKFQLEEAMKVLHNETKNTILLEAICIYQNVKKYRDELLVRVGELDEKFCKYLLKKADEDRVPVDLEEDAGTITEII